MLSIDRFNIIILYKRYNGPSISEKRDLDIENGKIGYY